MLAAARASFSSERKTVVVRDQRVHPVDGDELLGQRVRDAVVVGRRARDAADDLVRSSAGRSACTNRSPEAPPVRPQREDRRRVGDDRRRPVDRVDLRHQRRVDEPRLLVELPRRRAPGAVRGGRSQIALCSRMKSECRSARPTQKLPATPGEVDVRLQLLRRQAPLVEAELAVLARAERVGEGLVAAVDLRAVPPVRVVGDERRRPVSGRASGRGRVRWIFIGSLAARVVVRSERDLPRLLGLRACRG